MAGGSGTVGAAGGDYHTPGRRRERLLLSAFAIFLVLYGNVKTHLLDPSPAGSPYGVLAGLALVGLVAAWALARRFRAADLGVALDDVAAVRRSLRAGALTGLFFGLFPIALAALGLMPPDRPEADLGWGPLVWRVTLYLPLSTALPEELAFRGLLLAWLMRVAGLNSRRPLGPPLPGLQRPSLGSLAAVIRGLPTDVAAWIRRPVGQAVLLAALPFALWHLEIAWSEMREPRLLELIGKLFAIYLGGVLFGYLRVATGHLAGSVIAHWLFDALGMLAARGAADLA